MMRNILAVLFLLPLFAPGLLTAAELDVMEDGRSLTQTFYAGKIDTIWNRFNSQMRQALESKDRLAVFADRIQSQFGAETEVVNEKVMRQGSYRIYRRTVHFEKVPEEIWVQWALADNGQIGGFFIKPAPGATPTEYLSYQTKTQLRLPFNGEWYVFWGGKTIENNYHAQVADQRFAYDFLVMNEGSSHVGDGEQLEDYHCWGEPILAPASGTVAVAVSLWPDNQPGEMDTEHPPGNYVVIDHGNSEYSFLAHLQQGSVSVETGDEVEADDTIGLCGNSGNTTEPHLHYHLQTTSEFSDGLGLPAQFQSYLEDGEFVERGIPVKGQTVAPADLKD